jgi:hypothetical protein
MPNQREEEEEEVNALVASTQPLNAADQLDLTQVAVVAGKVDDHRRLQNAQTFFETHAPDLDHEHPR